jgi:T4 beta protein
MLDHHHYLSVLKGRLGEYGALQAMSSDAKDFLTPLIEIPPIPWNYAAKQPAKTIDQHLLKVGTNIERAWGRDQPLFVDLMWIGEDERLANGLHPVTYVLGTTRDRGVHAIPVTGLARDAEYQRACKCAIREDGRGVCLRIQEEDFEESNDLEFQMSRLLSDLNTRERETDLILDLRALGGTDPYGRLGRVVELIYALPKLGLWRSFALCGTAFPEDLMGIPPLNTSSIPRIEWALWKELVSNSNLVRVPTFGDYAIAHPQPSEVDPRIMRASASIRYTTDESWLILKGQNLRDHGFSQFHQVSAALLKDPQYSGPKFSWGDRYISDCANHLVSTGSLTTWRKVGTSHHIAYVMRQLANFSSI